MRYSLIVLTMALGCLQLCLPNFATARPRMVLKAQETTSPRATENSPASASKHTMQASLERSSAPLAVSMTAENVPYRAWSSSGRINLRRTRSGEYLVPCAETLIENHSEEPLALQALQSTIWLEKNSTCLIANSKLAVHVYNLSDNHRNSVHILINQTTFNLDPGQELVLAGNATTLVTVLGGDQQLRRVPSTFEMPDGKIVLLCDYAPGPLFGTSSVLRSIYRIKAGPEKATINNVLKTAASLYYATAGHGAYVRIE